MPSQRAFMYLLPQIGFAKVEVLVPPPDGYEQLARRMRMMIAGTVQTGLPENARP